MGGGAMKEKRKEKWKGGIWSQHPGVSHPPPPFPPTLRNSPKDLVDLR